MAKKSALAQIQRSMKAAAREAEKAQRQRERAHAAAVRESERAQKAAERAAVKADRAAEAERKRLEKEAKAAHQAAKQAEVDELNAELEARYDEIDGMLDWTLEIDDFVDLESLRQTVEHPPFDRTDLESPVPAPAAQSLPSEPIYEEPAAPRALFGKKRKHEEAISAAKSAHERRVQEWKDEVARIEQANDSAVAEHAESERQRELQLERERKRYKEECAQRESEVAEQNAELDALISNLGYGTTEAIEEYLSIVLANSLYPDHFPVEHDFSFAPAIAELTLRCVVPEPDEMSRIKAFRYTKASDQITETQLSQKAVRDRYTGAIHQVALRSLHEVFEADRRGLVRSISLEVGTQTANPATGQEGFIPFVAVAAERDAFSELDLSAVVPTATLDHLGAAVSKNPMELVPAGTSGVRRT